MTWASVAALPDDEAIVGESGQHPVVETDWSMLAHHGRADRCSRRRLRLRPERVAVCEPTLTWIAPRYAATSTELSGTTALETIANAALTDRRAPYADRH
jgi:hypothetical protein